MDKIKVILIVCFIVSYCYGQDTRGLRESMNEFWNCETVVDKQKAAKKIIRLKPDFYEVYRALKEGKTYSENVKKGFIEKNITTPPGLKHYNMIFIPYNYDPRKKYEVKLFLHGAVSQSNPKQLSRWIDTSDVEWKNKNHIGIYPSAWCESKWWENSQMENINKLLFFVKENYNVDENQLHITGISDGATGTYYLANCMPTPFSVFIPLIGSLEAIAWNGEKQVYFQNYNSLSFFIVNTRKDNIFKINQVEPYIQELKNNGCLLNYIAVDSSGHNTNWYPQLKDSIKQFIDSNIRNPFPSKVMFSTENLVVANRKYWIRIDQLGHYGTESKLADPNEVEFQGKKVKAFIRLKPTGQIEAEIENNIIRVKTKGLMRYTLLLSPEQIDFSKPIKIYTNQNITYEGSVSESLDDLLNNFILDQDRCMLYAVELCISLDKKFRP